MGIGWDEISLCVIKMVAHEISGPLSCVLNCCIRGESLPGFIKVARVMPVLQLQASFCNPYSLSFTDV
jgi:uncharacterized protein YpmS